MKKRLDRTGEHPPLLRWHYGILLVLCGIAPLWSATASAQPSIIGPLLQAELERTPPDAMLHIDVVLHDDWHPTLGVGRLEWVRQRQDEVVAPLPAGEFTLTHRYESLCGFAGIASRKAIDQLSEDRRVARIALDARGRLDVAQGVPLVGASAAQALGFTGSGVTVAVLDSGVDPMHPDLVGAVIAEECFCTEPGPGGCCPNGEDRDSGPGSAEDTDGHGTAVSGIVTGDGVQEALGVAPDAAIVALKVGDTNGSIGLSDVGSALDWLLQRDAFDVPNHVSLGVRVVNLSISFGGPLNDASICAGLNNAAVGIAALHSAGVAVFASSGNSGWPNGVAFPACVPEAVAVGAVYDADFGSLNWGVCSDASAAMDTYACFTNSGDLLDLLAPGWQTTTAGRPRFGGTSAAAAYASGQAALLFEADGDLSPAEVLDLLRQSGPLVANLATGVSYPRPDVAQALEALGAAPVPVLSGPGLPALIGLLALVSVRTLRRQRRSRSAHWIA
ncbi:MAG: S8 family serine peptidase [Myxococcota bacterium]|nr:S8 family serine peptidase [Myxococcota bacterium]